MAVARSLKARASAARRSLKEAGGTLRPDEQEPHTRLSVLGRVCTTRRSPCRRRAQSVNGAGRWRERQRSYPGRPAGYARLPGKCASKGAAELAGVSRGHRTSPVTSGRRKGRTQGKGWVRHGFARRATTAENPKRELPAGGSGEPAGDRRSAESFSGTPRHFAPRSRRQPDGAGGGATEHAPRLAPC